MMTMLFLTLLLGAGIYFAAQAFSAVLPIYGTLSQILFFSVTALYLWNLLLKGRR